MEHAHAKPWMSRVEAGTWLRHACLALGAPPEVAAFAELSLAVSPDATLATARSIRGCPGPLRPLGLFIRVLVRCIEPLEAEG